jgi:hypothetical protein
MLYRTTEFPEHVEDHNMVVIEVDVRKLFAEKPDIKFYYDQNVPEGAAVFTTDNIAPKYFSSIDIKTTK